MRASSSNGSSSPSLKRLRTSVDTYCASPKKADFLSNVRNSFDSDIKKKKLFLRCASILQANDDDYYTDAIKSVLEKFDLKVYEIDLIVNCSLGRNKDDAIYPHSIMQLLFDLGYEDIEPHFIRIPARHNDDLDLCHSFSFENLDLEGMDFRGCDLRHANFTSAHLEYAHFEGAQLQGADFECSYLQGAFFEGAKLNHADFKQADMRNCDFTNSILLRANFLQAELCHSNFMRADAKEANFQMANLESTCFNYALLNLANFEEANLMSCRFIGADLSDTIFKSANLNYVNFHMATIRRTDFRQANMINVNIIGDLNTANLEDTINFSLCIPHLDTDDDILDVFDHIHNENDISILTTIDSVSDENVRLKLRLMEQLILKINRFPSELKERVTTQCRMAFLNILNQESSPYFSSVTILRFIERYLLQNIFERLNHNSCGKKVFKEMKELFIHIIRNNEDNRDFYLSNTGFISQFIYFLKHDGSEDEVYANIEDMYVKHFPEAVNKAYEILTLFGEYDDEEVPSLKDNMLLISQDEEHCLLVSYKYYEEFFLEIDSNYHSFEFFYFKALSEYEYSDPILEDIDLKEIFRNIVLFQEKYFGQVSLNKIWNLLDEMNLGEHNDFFKSIMNRRGTKIKIFNHHSSQEGLLSFFRPHLIPLNDDEHAFDMKITDALHEKIAVIYDFENISPKKQSLVYICLAAIFIQLCSKEFMGTENLSPLALRYLSIGFVNKANEIDPMLLVSNLHNSSTMVSHADDWRNRLAGTNGAFTCASILYSKVKQLVSEQDENIFKLIVPLALL